MKMNSLAALLDVLGGIEAGGVGLQSLWPRTYTEEVAGLSVAELGSQPILHMRSFQQIGRLSDALVDDIMARSGAAMA
jgi:quinolinate synthase